MVKLNTPKIVISIPRLGAYFVVGCFIMYALETGNQPTNNQPLHSAPTSSHENVIVTPPPAVPLQPAPTTTTGSSKTTAATTALHSAQPAPVVTPAPSASVSGLAPVNPTPASTSSNSSTPSQPATPVTSSYTSTNWAGYMATTGSYTAVSGSWTVPSATGMAGKSSYDATWIGIGGVTTNDLIQVGTDNTVSASGHETSAAFYEMLPQSSRSITSLTVSPGDAMNASLSEVSTGQWKISITDVTTGTSYTVTVSYTSSYSSAEWIEEDPSTVSNRLIPLDNFTPVSFTGDSATSKGSSLTLAAGNAQPVTMVSATTKQPVATPSTLSSDGQGFTVIHN